MVLPEVEPVEARRVILVVDDEILVRMIVAEYLREAGYQVVEAGNADEALEYLRTQNPVELVFSDVRMPGSLDGLEFARQARRLYPDLPVILASGDLPPGEAGERPFLPKPYILGEVEAKIRRILDGTGMAGSAGGMVA